MMMIERHYDDEALVTMLGDGISADDAHLSTCEECTEKLHGFRLAEDALRDASTWDKREIDPNPNPNTIATLRAFADTMAAEDSAAEAYLADLLAGPRETWMAKLHAHPEYRTAGTVRRLIAATNHALDTMPADAVEITALATEIAEHLETGLHGEDTLARLRGAAWRERAYACYYTGHIAEAQKAVALSTQRFENCALSEYERARVSVVRALIFRSLEGYLESRDAARTAADQFEVFADVRRASSARLAEVQSCFGRGDFEGALQILLVVERRLRDSDDAETHARTVSNLAFCYWKLNRIDEAIKYHEIAANLVDALGIRSESVRTRWNIASILAGEGRIDEALSRLEHVYAEFGELGMASVATLVRLEAAELMLLQGRYTDVVGVCRAAMAEFTASGLDQTERALTALALMKEAAVNRTATPSLARHVREYLRRLPDEPNLLFLPPPSE